MSLFRAFELYKNPTYRRLVGHFGIRNTYILSAGWGLINAAFLTPKYDITFSAIVKKKHPHKLQNKNDQYKDFCMLPDRDDEELLFWGGKDYLPRFCALTRSLRCKKTIFYKGKRPNVTECVLQQYVTDKNINWHYECANAFLDNTK